MGCGGDCDQGRRPCACRARVPMAPVEIVDLSYQAGPFPRVARWLDDHPRTSTALAALGLLALFVIGAWLDGAAP